jgi:hypothetical protein
VENPPRFRCTPSMGADLEVKVLYRGGNPYCEPKARASPRGGVWRKLAASLTVGGTRSASEAPWPG